MAINLGRLKRFAQGGRGDMGTVEARFKNTGRFTMDVPQFVLVSYKAILGQYAAPNTSPAIETPTGKADLSFLIDHAQRLSDTGGDGAGGAGTEISSYAFEVHRSINFGVDNANLNVRLDELEMRAGTMFRGDWLVANWTNPETTGDLRWHLEVVLAELL